MSACPYKFSELNKNYPRTEREPLYQELGWSSIANNEAYANTCAIRMSICLLRSGMLLQGGELTIWKGPLARRSVKIRFDQLALYLEKQWGAPEKFSLADYRKGIAGKRGVIVFWELPGGYPGHIDIYHQKTVAVPVETKAEVPFLWFFTREITTTKYVQVPVDACGSGCYFGSEKVWFWEAG